jgi:hypothetical protein
MNDKYILTKTNDGECPACGIAVPPEGYHICECGIKVLGDEITSRQITASEDIEILEELKEIKELLKAIWKPQ